MPGARRKIDAAYSRSPHHITVHSNLTHTYTLYFLSMLLEKHPRYNSQTGGATSDERRNPHFPISQAHSRCATHGLLARPAQPTIRLSSPRALPANPGKRTIYRRSQAWRNFTRQNNGRCHTEPDSTAGKLEIILHRQKIREAHSNLPCRSNASSSHFKRPTKQPRA